MSKIQLERLNNDLRELQTYNDKVTRKGNKDLVNKLKRKYNFLSNKLAEAA